MSTNKKRTVRECQSMLFKLGVEFGISPKIISSKLLSIDDKNDMLEGLISYDALRVAVERWIAVGKPDYAKGSNSSNSGFY